ncbi:hypothetical protein [Sorangium sp. So ce1078]|uniref:hypothetical protein n=1 Tax=Sorangium sp. So ce1078 TaxID=3133329 RepID=UPI003F647E56
MKNAGLRSIPLVIAAAFCLFAAGAAGCNGEESLHACSELCKHRILCAEEQEVPPPSKTSCETACLGLEGDGLVERTEECVNEASCDYVACADP